jgi:hypothetical protein
MKIIQPEGPGGGKGEPGVPPTYELIRLVGISTSTI